MLLIQRIEINRYQTRKPLSIPSNPALSPSGLDASKGIALGGARDGCTGLVYEWKGKALSATGALRRDPCTTDALREAAADTALVPFYKISM